MTRTKEDIKNDIKKLQKELKLVRDSEKISKKDHIECAHCQELNKLNTLDVIVELFYVEPMGCSDGDYWTEGKSPTYFITCPKCKVTSRYEEAMYDEKPIMTKRKDMLHWPLINKNRWGKKFKSVESKERERVY